MIVNVREIPVTFRAAQVGDSTLAELVDLLFDTEWDVREGRDGVVVLVLPQPSYEKYGYVENRSTERLWDEHWIVVSSKGEVRRLMTEQYKKEFELV